MTFGIRINSYFAFRTLLQVGDPSEDNVSELTLTGSDQELMIDTFFTFRLKKMLSVLK